MHIFCSVRLLDWSMKAASPCPVLDHGVLVSKGHHRGVMSHLIRIQWSHFCTQRSPTLSTPSQSVTDSLLITSHPTPEPVTVWYRWNLTELTFTQQTDRFKSQIVIFTLTTLQTAPPDDPKLISVTNLTQTRPTIRALLPLKNTEIESGLHCLHFKRSGLMSFFIKWNGLVS